MTGNTQRPLHPPHRGGAVKVGPYTVYAGGARDLAPEDFDEFDVLVPLTERLPEFVFGDIVLLSVLPDFGGVPDDWQDHLEDRVIPLLEWCNATDRKMLAFCTASHGRTGTFLASLIALLESEEETPDPIAAVRERHCSHAVETKAQAEGIFALRGQKVPEKYLTGPDAFHR